LTRLDRQYIIAAARVKQGRSRLPEPCPEVVQIMANDEHLAELTRQAKERISEPARG
jgi:hypothetical protein